MSQPQITSALILNYFKSRGMDTSKDQSQNPEFMRTYREIAETIRMWNSGEDRDQARRELEEMRLAFKERNSLRNYSAKLAKISVTEKGQIRNAATDMRVATLKAQTELAKSRSVGFDRTIPKLETQLTNVPAAKGAADRLATAIAGSLTAEGEYGGIPSSSYSNVLDWAADKGVDFRDPTVMKRLEKGNAATAGSMKLFIERADRGDSARKNVEVRLAAEDATQAKLIAALDKAKTSDVDTVADLQRQLQLSTAKSAELVEGMDMGTDEATVNTRIADLDEKDASLKILEARFARMDAQLSAGTGPISEDEKTRSQIARTIGRENFRQWAKDNGYTEDEIGYIDYDEDGMPIMSSFAPGTKTLRAMGQFEHQTTNPNRHSRLFGPSSRTNEVHVFDVAVDPAMAERFKHSDGKWVTSTDENGIERYVTEGESRDYLSRYVMPTVKVGVGDDGKAYLKTGSEANPVYYEVDGETGKPINGAYYERADGPKTWATKAGDPGLVLRDAEGNATRYLQADDLADVGAVDFSMATDEDRQALNSEYGDLNIGVVDSPPAAATRTVTARLLKTDAMDVYHGRAAGQNHRSYIDVSTNLEFRIDPTEIKNLKSYQTKSDTNFKDFTNFLGSRRQTRIAEKAQDTSEIEYEEKMVNGVMTREYGSTKLNVFDKLQGKITGPDLKPDKAEESAIAQERAVEAVQEDRQLARDALGIARQDREAATKRFNEAAEGSQESKDAYAEMVATQKVVRKTEQALLKIERKLAKDADPLARVTGAELPDDLGFDEGAELVDAPTTTRAEPAPTRQDALDILEGEVATERVPDPMTGKIREVPVAERGAVLDKARALAEEMKVGRISADPMVYLKRLKRAYELSDNDPEYLPLIAIAQADVGYLDEAQKTIDQYTQTEGVDIGPDSMASSASAYLGLTEQKRVQTREDFDARMADREFAITPMAEDYSPADVPDIVASGDPTQAFADAQLRREGKHPDQIAARKQKEEDERAAAALVKSQMDIDPGAGVPTQRGIMTDMQEATGLTEDQIAERQAEQLKRRAIEEAQQDRLITGKGTIEIDKPPEGEGRSASEVAQQLEIDAAMAETSPVDLKETAALAEQRTPPVDKSKERVDQSDALMASLETGADDVAQEIEQKRAVATEKRAKEAEDKRKKDAQIAQQAAAGEGIDAVITPPTKTKTVEADDDDEDDVPEVEGGPSLKPEAAKGKTGAQDKQRAQILAALQGRESAESKKRQESDKGQPSPASPTETAKAGPDTMVPSLSDKDKAEAKTLVEKMRQIQDIIYEMDQSGVA